MTGLQEDCICTDLKPYLQDTKVTDEILLERLSIVYNMEMERKNYQLLVKDVKVTVVQDDEISIPEHTSSLKKETACSSKPNTLVEKLDARNRTICDVLQSYTSSQSESNKKS